MAIVKWSDYALNCIKEQAHYIAEQSCSSDFHLILKRERRAFILRFKVV